MLLTNGICWRVYHVVFAKPIDHELVVDIDFCALSAKSADDLDKLYLWCKEGWVRSVLGEYHTQKQALSRFFVGAVLVSDPVLAVIRRELRRVTPDIKVESDQVKDVLINEIIKREVMEGDKAQEAKRKLARVTNKAQRAKDADDDETPKSSGTTAATHPEQA